MELKTKSGEVFILTDNDMWGISCAIQHGVQSGYFKEPKNMEWAKAIQEKIDRIRVNENPLYRDGFEG